MRTAEDRHATEPGGRIRFLMLFLVLASALAFWSAWRSARPIRGTAEAGVLSLSAHDLDGELSLEGPWTVFPGALLSPTDFADPKPPLPQGELRFPGTWKGTAGLTDRGEATFRLRLIPPPGERRMILRLMDIHIAYRLWADGNLIAQSGVPGRSETTEDAHRSLVLAPLVLRGEPVDLTLQVSNHHFRKGGVAEPILLSSPGVAEAARARSWVLSACFCGVLAVTAIYHLSIYALRRHDPPPLYFGLYALLLLVYAAGSNTTLWLAGEILPRQVPPAAMEGTALLSYVAASVTLYRFFLTLYPDAFSRRLRVASDLRLPVFVVAQAAFPSFVAYWVILGLLLLTIPLSGYYIARMTVCVRRGRPGADILLVGCVILAGAAVNDILIHAGAIEGSYLVMPGLFAFVLFQALTLAMRFTRSFAEVERLSSELEGKNSVLRAEMEERDRLEREVIAISEDERRRIGHELHDGLCQQLTAARLRCSVLAENLSGQTGFARDARALGGLLAATTEDAYALSRGLWPVEHDPAAPGPSLEELVRSVRRDDGVSVELHQDRHCAKCANPHATALYRIAQEALSNAMKHAQASHVRVSLTCAGDGRVELIVQDDGIGRIAADQGHGGGLGLRIMAHRANVIEADLSIADAPGGGTVVRCIAPCSRGAAIRETAR
ncbi:Diverse 7TM receptor transmembrane region [uncultured Alphaproteobacteria bacterium]|uniref:Diverse 7TM receptor transmembrane region n=1 Tax=uncultured Alphaproteobacteria bacterium TaxID=91750 RepID=A0A212JHI2_9PROT|nr:Diverse 7TM receptor transmembrane region [uncultured Alphaproteobacteria bacterium]